MTRAELAHAVNEYVWSTTGKTCHLDADTLARYERGQIRWPSEMYRNGLRMVLGAADDAELGFQPTRRGRVVTDGRIPEEMGDVAERVARAIGDPRRFAGGEVVEAYRLQLGMAKALDGRHGAATALPMALGVVGGLWTLATEAPSAIRGDVLTLGAEAAEFTGWLYRDLADTAQAVHWYDRAMEYAQAAGDSPMQGFVLIRKSQMAYEAGEGHRVLLFGRAALDGPWRLPRRLRAEATLQVALGEAMTGSRRGVIGAIDRAQSLSDEGGVLLNLRAAPCWIEAGHPGRAVEILDEALGSDELSVRDRGFFRARQAAALAALEMGEDAVQHATHAVETAASTGSRRTLSVVRGALAQLGAVRPLPQVEALRSAVSSLS